MMCAFPPKGGCIAPPIIHAMSRFMALSFAVHRSRSGAKRSPFKAKLNVALRQSQIGEVATFETTFRDDDVREFRLTCGVHSTRCTNEALISANQLREGVMKIIRREFLFLSGITVAVPAMSKFALAQAQAGPKLTQVLRKDLENQGQLVQETIVSVVEFGPGTAAPWHMHPGAQELLHVFEGNVMMEIEGKGAT